MFSSRLGLGTSRCLGPATRGGIELRSGSSKKQASMMNTSRLGVLPFSSTARTSIRSPYLRLPTPSAPLRTYSTLNSAPIRSRSGSSTSFRFAQPSRSKLAIMLFGGGSAVLLFASSDLSPFASRSKTEDGLARDGLISTVVAISPSDAVDVPPLPTDAPVPSKRPRSLSSTLKSLILEPILTFFRFLHLALLFGPVILTAPMIYVGSLGDPNAVGPDGQKRWRKWKGRAKRARARGRADASARSRAGSTVRGEDDEDMGIGLQNHGTEDMEEERWGAVWWYGFLVGQMERAGPTFIKLGQWAASRADLFPASLCDLMGKLHSNGKPHDFAHTKRYIEAVFGLGMDEIFDEFGKEPIGCGAIAQVYRAKLRKEILPEGFLEARGIEPAPAATSDATGREVAATTSKAEDANTSVAIKVLHPRVEQTIRRDLAIMNVFASALNLIPGMIWLSLPDEVEVFGQMMNSQLDLRVEADNLDRFHENFKKRGARGVSFPRPIRLDRANGRGTGDEEKREEAVSRVLVEEFEDALPLKYFLRNGGEEYDDRIANIGLDAFLNMLLIDNWTHGDLHPGNIMVRFYKPTTKDILKHLSATLFHTAEPDEVMTEDTATIVENLRNVSHDPVKWRAALNELEDKGYEPELIFIDAGLVTALNTDNRRNFLDLFQAVAEFDGYRAGQLMVERCRTPELVVDKETFALKMQHLVLSVKSKTFSLAAIKISDILTDVLSAVRTHHVKMEGDFVNTVISILLLEGIGRQLDPNMDLFKSAVPIMRQLGRQMGTKEAISHVDAGNIWALAKIWLWVEAREVAGFSSSEKMDEYIKFDRFMPNI